MDQNNHLVVNLDFFDKIFKGVYLIYVQPGFCCCDSQCFCVENSSQFSSSSPINEVQSVKTYRRLRMDVREPGKRHALTVSMQKQ